MPCRGIQGQVFERCILAVPGSAVLLEFLQKSFTLGVQFFHFLEIVFRGTGPGAQFSRLQESQLTIELPYPRFDLSSAFRVHVRSQAAMLLCLSPG